MFSSRCKRKLGVDACVEQKSSPRVVVNCDAWPSHQAMQFLIMFPAAPSCQHPACPCRHPCPSRSGGGTGGLLAGTKTIYLCIVTDGFNIDSFTMTAVANSPHGPTGTDPAGGPYGGKAAVIPGTIDATKFDLGGQGVAYSDTDPGNNGGVRPTFFFVDMRFLELCAGSD